MFGVFYAPGCFWYFFHVLSLEILLYIPQQLGYPSLPTIISGPSLHTPWFNLPQQPPPNPIALR